MAPCGRLAAQLFAGLMLLQVAMSGDPPSYVHHKVSMDDAKSQLAPHQRGLKRGQDVAPAVPADVKFIRCQVCQELVRESLRQIDIERRGLKRTQVLHEEVILERLENVCDVDGDGGDWIRRFDMVEDGDRILLNDTKKNGDTCDTECRTIERACNEVLDHIDQNAVSETVFKRNMTNTEILNWLCSEETACKPAPPVPADRKPGPVHSTTKMEVKKRMKNEKRAKLAAKKAAKAAAAKEAGESSEDEAAVEVVTDKKQADDEADEHVIKLDIHDKEDLDPVDVKQQLLEQGFVENIPSHDEL